MKKDLYHLFYYLRDFLTHLIYRFIFLLTIYIDLINTIYYNK